MKILRVSISDIEFQKFAITNEHYKFNDLVDLIRKVLAAQNLDKCLALSEKYGIVKMTMDEISSEVKAVRQNKKNIN